MRKENMKNTPEQLNSSPTEASKEFLGGWGREIMISFNAVNLGTWSFLAGMDLATGHNETVLLKGICAGCYGIATVLKGLSMASENRSLKDQMTQLQGQNKK